ncbi:uncharacterized protein RHOBADRAFT_45751 [Rhodotorula graminis WP1]|uniref:F-box domain-containing protein n=1 Tax=Rhodotorula graminis (strain WP1) TaxID=578459 RepID=A0A0P9ENT8_RHOGW|nr:uncharacterized protein RHOBADRAFT_45751 [Rhodotorula graminis WP1]KPV73790.1 hypothetical protein RHOBADRAFT_45751 [Rhodotorula graminis WP1]
MNPVAVVKLFIARAHDITGPPIFPQEIFNLILEHLENIVHPLSRDAPLEAEADQRMLGDRMKRVSPAWLTGGRRIAWSRVTCFWDVEDKLVKFLFEQPALAREIRELLFQPGEHCPTRTAPGDHRRQTVDVVELIKTCSGRLDKLFFVCPVGDHDLWAQVTSSVMAATLSELSLLVDYSNDALLFELRQGLAHFVRLKILGVIIETDRGLSARRSVAQPAPIAIRLRITRFTFEHVVKRATSSSVLASSFFAQLLEPERLHSLALKVSLQEAEQLNWIGAFRRLRFISLSCAPWSPNFRPVTAHIALFAEAIASLPELGTVRINPAPARDLSSDSPPVPSPVPLSHLLAQMPPRIKTYRIGGGVFFTDNVGLPGIPRHQWPPPDVCLKLSLKVRRDWTARLVRMYRRTGPDHVQTWSILPENVVGPLDDIE